VLVVKVELHSARTGAITEIGRMVIVNDGTGTQERGNYNVGVLRKGSQSKVQHETRVENYPRLSYSVWELVRRGLNSIYGERK